MLRRYFSFERLLKYQNSIPYLVCRNSAIQGVTVYLQPVLVTSTPNKRRDSDQTPGPRLNAPGVYLKIGSFDPAFKRYRRLIEKIRYC